MHFWRWKWWQIILNDCCNTSQAQLPNSVENNFSGRLPGIQYRVRMRNMMNLHWWWYEWKCPSSLKEQMIMMIIMFTREIMETYKSNLEIWWRWWGRRQRWWWWWWRWSCWRRWRWWSWWCVEQAVLWFMRLLVALNNPTTSSLSAFLSF